MKMPQLKDFLCLRHTFNVTFWIVTSSAAVKKHRQNRKVFYAELIKVAARKYALLKALSFTLNMDEINK